MVEPNSAVLESNAEGEYHQWGLEQLLASISFTPHPDALAAAAILVLLLLGSALISGSEVAFFSLGKPVLTTLNMQEKRVKRLMQLLERPRLLLATILIANNLFNISIVILSYFIISSTFTFGEAAVVQFMVEVVLVTFVIVLLGEVVPKVYANHHNVNFALAMAGPLLVLRSLFRPLAMLLVSSTRVLEQRLGSRAMKQVSREEVDHAIDLATDKGTSEAEKDILKGIVKFGDITVKQIMQPRMDIVAIDTDSTFRDVFAIVLDSGFSRIPVYRDNLDQMEGVLYAKDLLKYLHEADTFDWRVLLRPAFFVPEAKKIERLLQEFQQRHIHLAIAVDEYGGTAGIITLEDIMEEIIGEINDEYDEQEKLPYERLDDNTYVFEGKIQLNDMMKLLGLRPDQWEEERGDSDSLAGLLLEVFQKMPVAGDSISLDGYRFEVVAVTRRRIQKVRIELPKTGGHD